MTGKKVTPPVGATSGMLALFTAIDKGRSKDAAACVSALTDDERRDCLPALKQFRRALREHWWHTEEKRRALWIAGAGCCTGAAAAAQWLAASDLRWSVRQPSLVLAALSDRKPEWIGDVARRLAARDSVAEQEHELIAALVRASGCEVPTTDGFVIGWIWHLSAWSRQSGTLVDRLRKDPFLPVLAPRLFEAANAGVALDNLDHYKEPGPDTWAGALTQLAVEGEVERRVLVDGCLSRLLRGGDRPGGVRAFLKVLDALALTEDEQAAHATTWVRMLPDGHSTVAARAQQALAVLDTAGRLHTEHLVEASHALLFRPEKKLVRAQLTLLDKAIRRDTTRTDELLLAAAQAFTGEHHDMQERALTLINRHLKHTAETTRAQLATAAHQLTPGLRAKATHTLGTPTHQPPADRPTTPTHTGDALPPPPQPQPLTPTPSSPEELAEDLAALLRGDNTSEALERTLNGLVTHAHHNRHHLIHALQPVVDRHPLHQGWYGEDAPIEIGDVVDAVLGTVKRKRLTKQPASRLSRLDGALFVGLFEARLCEVALRIADGDPVPFLLATPTWVTGGIDPAALVDRIRAYEQAGIEPGRIDLEQALLRVRPEADPQVQRAAATLQSPAGCRLAVWLADGGLPEPTTVRETAQWSPFTWQPRRSLVLVSSQGLPSGESFAEPVRALISPFTKPPQRSQWPYDWHVWPDAHSLAALPWHRELVAARELARLLSSEDGQHTAFLPALAESGGAAGPAVHLALAYGLVAGHASHRLSAVDALLILAARGQLDPAMLGRDLAELASLGAIKLQRLADALTQAARAGAYTTVWSVLAAALPGLLVDAAGGAKPAHGLGAVVTVAAECAEQSSATGQIAEVTAVADRAGSSQLVKQARRLTDALERR